MTCSILIQVAYVGLTDDPPNLEGYFSVFYGCQESYEMNVLHFYMLVCHLTGSFRIGSLSTYNGDGAPGTNLGVVPKNISRDSHIPSLFNRPRPSKGQVKLGRSTNSRPLPKDRRKLMVFIHISL